ncbi:glycosyltransferase [Buttiauxella sp. HR94]|nr:glycosyltransferase [Buttiauxella sp. HR94]
MEKLLYISMSLEKSNYGGSIVSRANLKGLKANEHLQIKEIAVVRKEEGVYGWELLAKSSKVQTAINNLSGYAGRLNATIYAKIKNIIQEYQPTTVYLDSSMLGSLAEWCKRAHPNIRVVTFFHNVEVDFEVDRLKSGKVQFFPSLIATTLAEKKAVNYSDMIITLHQADADRLYQLYHRKADFCVPVCIVDEPIAEDVLHGNTIGQERPFRVGFIGTAFFANTQAAEYIAQKIAPMFTNDNDIEFVIAGNGFEGYAGKLDKENLKTSGYVESLADFYKHVDVILSPITTGAGMKVKIAEALKYNKKVIASPFTLIGYEQALDSNNDDIVSCNSLEEYVAAVKKIKGARLVPSSTRRLFEQYYSDSACAEYFKKIFHPSQS